MDQWAVGWAATNFMSKSNEFHMLVQALIINELEIKIKRLRFKINNVK